MNAAIPAIEVTDDADALRAGSPHRKVYALNAFDGDDMGAHLFVGVVMAAFAHEVQIKFGEDNGKGIRIEYFKRIAEMGAALDFVAAGSRRRELVRGPRSLEESLGTKLDGVTDFCRRKRGTFDGGRS